MEDCYKDVFAASSTPPSDGSKPKLIFTSDRENTKLCVFEIITTPQQLDASQVARTALAVQAFRKAAKNLGKDRQNKRWARTSCPGYMRYSSLQKSFVRQPNQGKGCVPKMYLNRLDLPRFYTGLCKSKGGHSPAKCITSSMYACIDTGKGFYDIVDDDDCDENYPACTPSKGWGEKPPLVVGWRIFARRFDIVL